MADSHTSTQPSFNFLSKSWSLFFIIFISAMNLNAKTDPIKSPFVANVPDKQGPLILGIEPQVCGDTSMPELTIINNCDDGEIEVSMSEDTISTQDGSSQFFIRRMWSATDACGTTTELEQMIAMNDVTAPELTYHENFGKLVGDNVVVNMSNLIDMEELSKISYYSVLGREKSSGEIIDAEFTENVITSMDTLAKGWHEQRLYTWEVVDACGNANKLTTNITIVNDIGH